MLKNFLIFTLSLIPLIPLILNFRFYQQISNQNIVIEVVDGDTFQLKSGKSEREATKASFTKASGCH